MFFITFNLFVGGLPLGPCYASCTTSSATPSNHMVALFYISQGSLCGLSKDVTPQHVQMVQWQSHNFQKLPKVKPPTQK